MTHTKISLRLRQCEILLHRGPKRWRDGNQKMWRGLTQTVVCCRSVAHSKMLPAAEGNAANQLTGFTSKWRYYEKNRSFLTEKCKIAWLCVQTIVANYFANKEYKNYVHLRPNHLSLYVGIHCILCRKSQYMLGGDSTARPEDPAIKHENSS